MTDAFVPPLRPTTEFGGSDRQASRRCSLRVAGPFDGRRMGPWPTPLRLHDLSLGGCLIERYDKAAVGQRLTLQSICPPTGGSRSTPKSSTCRTRSASPSGSSR